jgi:hypothetical protein
MCRRALVLVAMSIVVALAVATPAAAKSHGAQLVSESAKSDKPMARLACFAPTLICAGGQVAEVVGGAVGGAVGNVVTSGGSAVAASAMGGVVSWAAEGAAWLVGQVAEQIERSTHPELTDPWFAHQYDGMIALAAPLAVVFLLLAIIQAALAQDVSRMLRAVCVHLPCALLLTFAAVTLTQLALRVTDEMTAWVLAGTGNDMRTAFNALGKAFTASGPTPLAPFVLFLGSTFTALFALVVWLELVMREAAVYVAMSFLPLTLAAMIWEKTAHWARRLSEWLLAIVLAKFTIAVAFSLAASAITESPGGEAGLSAIVAGCAVLLIAGLTPWALLRILPFAEAAAGRSLSPSNVRGAASAIPGASSATFAARQLAFRNFGSMSTTRAGSVSPAPGAAPALAPGGHGSDQGPPDLPHLPDRRPVRENKEKAR